MRPRLKEVQPRVCARRILAALALAATAGCSSPSRTAGPAAAPSGGDEAAAARRFVPAQRGALTELPLPVDQILEFEGLPVAIGLAGPRLAGGRGRAENLYVRIEDKVWQFRMGPDGVWEMSYRPEEGPAHERLIEHLGLKDEITENDVFMGGTLRAKDSDLDGFFDRLSGARQQGDLHATFEIERDPPPVQPGRR